MYGLFASATLVLALLSEGTRAALHGVLNDYGISTEAVNGGVKHVRVEDNVVKVKARSGETMYFEDAKLAKHLNEVAAARSTTKRSSVSQVKNIFQRADCGDQICGNGPDATCSTTAYCTCFEACGPGGGCFSSCV